MKLYAVVEWYQKNKRDLPWRHTDDPYKIWISEIILQQTRVEQGLPYYLNFINRFDNVKTLAQADEDEVLKYWQGLGYYSRARNLLAAAIQIQTQFMGKFPNTKHQLLQLKGIGNYTASAIASFAFNEKVAVVDGNVFRVIARLFNITTPSKSAKGLKEVEKILEPLMPEKNTSLFNQALMEFGALHCVPKSPDCVNCELKEMCYAYQNKKVALLPVTLPKIKVKDRFFYYIVAFDKGLHRSYLSKRTKDDIWKNLYEFPLIETTSKQEMNDLISTKEWKRILKDINYTITGISESYLHKLSHQTIHAVFIRVIIDNPFNLKGLKSIKTQEIDKFAISRLTEKYIKQNKMF